MAVGGRSDADFSGTPLRSSLNRYGWMDQQERDNWQRVLDSLEAAGDTESAFYVRARAICDGDPDPMIEWEAGS